MKYLIKVSGHKSSQAAHELALDGVTALCGQKGEYPRAGVGGWEIREFEYRPWVVCSRCQEIRLAAEWEWLEKWQGMANGAGPERRE